MTSPGPWSCNKILPLIPTPNPWCLAYLLFWIKFLKVCEKRSYSTTLILLIQCSTCPPLTNILALFQLPELFALILSRFFSDKFSAAIKSYREPIVLLPPTPWLWSACFLSNTWNSKPIPLPSPFSSASTKYFTPLFPPSWSKKSTSSSKSLNFLRVTISPAVFGSLFILCFGKWIVPSSIEIIWFGKSLFLAAFHPLDVFPSQRRTQPLLFSSGVYVFFK